MNQKKPTIKDIAEACGVSTATVSYVLNQVTSQSIGAETKKRVLHQAHLMGYTSSGAARALATGRPDLVGVFLPCSELSPVKLGILNAVAKELDRQKFRLCLLTDRCMSEVNDGVAAVLAVDTTAEEFYAIGQQCFVPLLCLEGQTGDDLFYSFFFDAAELRRRGKERTGCKKVILCTEPPRNERYLSYLREHFEAVVPNEEAADFAFPDDTAILTDSPVVLRLLREKGISVLPEGSDDFPLPYSAYASLVVDVMLRAIDRNNPEAEHEIAIT